MKKTTKAVVLALCALVLVAASVFGTVAYLTAQDTVTNTFTVGSVAITLDEAKVNEDGTAVTPAERVKENKYHLLPGHTYTKDPTIHVGEDSEDCWLFVKVEDEIAGIQDATTIAEQMKTNGWTLVNGTTNIYAYEKVADDGDEVTVFESFKILGNVDNTTLANYEGESIVVTAYAVQADGFKTAAEAWNTTFGAA